MKANLIAVRDDALLFLNDTANKDILAFADKVSKVTSVSDTQAITQHRDPLRSESYLNMNG